MSEIRVTEHARGLRVSSAAWEIEHLANAGGTWASLLIKEGAGGNLLRGCMSSALRFADGGAFTAFEEKNEKSPALRVEQTAAGNPVVIAEGTYRDAAGRAIPVGYRRRTEYHEHGLIWTTLEIMSDEGCDGVVELRALELPLRAGPADCFARFHPTQAGGADLLGGHARYNLNCSAGVAPAPSVVFLSRFTPLQILCGTQGSEGIELFPGSELAQWDCALKPDPGLGLYMVAREAEGPRVILSPYCMAFRRMGARLQGKITLRLGIGLPVAKAKAEAAVEAVTMPANGEPGTEDLARIIATARQQGKKIVARISLNELHPAAPDFASHGRDWMHQAAPSLDAIHNERGALMCLNSGWLEAQKQAVDRILAALPWDGLQIDGSYHPCCHPGHARGPYHSDVEQYLDFLIYCRQRVGKGLLIVTGTPSQIARNLADKVV